MPIPGHEVSGEVAELGQGTTGLTVGQRVFGLTDWARDGTLAEYVGVEAQNLAPLPATTPKVGAVRPLAETRDAFLHRPGGQGKTIIQVA